MFEWKFWNAFKSNLKFLSLCYSPFPVNILVSYCSCYCCGNSRTKTKLFMDLKKHTRTWELCLTLCMITFHKATILNNIYIILFDIFFSMYVPVSSKEPVILWLLFVYVLVLQICFLFYFFYKNKAVSLVWIVLHCHFVPFIADYAVWAWLIVEGHIVAYIYNC